jgi:hypothetical protein
MASFDRRKCKGPLNGAKATGQHCREGWTFYPEPLPQLRGVTDVGSSEASYYTWVDQFDTFGLGANVPINTGNASEALLAFKDGNWVVLRVPYPTGFYTKWMDGRIDDPVRGWKGKGLWATISTRTPFHMETGKGTTSKVMHFQHWPDLFAKRARPTVPPGVVVGVGHALQPPSCRGSPDRARPSGWRGAVPVRDAARGPGRTPGRRPGPGRPAAVSARRPSTRIIWPLVGVPASGRRARRCTDRRPPPSAPPRRR